MNTKPKAVQQKKKKPYTRPEAKKVQLKPEEAVLGACKKTGSTGPGYSGCNLSGVYCNTNGS